MLVILFLPPLHIVALNFFVSWFMLIVNFKRLSTRHTFIMFVTCWIRLLLLVGATRDIYIYIMSV